MIGRRLEEPVKPARRRARPSVSDHAPREACDGQQPAHGGGDERFLGPLQIRGDQGGLAHRHAGQYGALAPQNLAKPRPKPPFDMTGTWFVDLRTAVSALVAAILVVALFRL